MRHATLTSRRRCSRARRAGAGGPTGGGTSFRSFDLAVHRHHTFTLAAGSFCRRSARTPSIETRLPAHTFHQAHCSVNGFAHGRFTKLRPGASRSETITSASSRQRIDACGRRRAGPFGSVERRLRRCRHDSVTPTRRRNANARPRSGSAIVVSNASACADLELAERFSIRIIFPPADQLFLTSLERRSSYAREVIRSRPRASPRRA